MEGLRLSKKQLARAGKSDNSCYHDHDYSGAGSYTNTISSSLQSLLRRWIERKTYIQEQEMHVCWQKTLFHFAVCFSANGEKWDRQAGCTCRVQLFFFLTFYSQNQLAKALEAPWKCWWLPVCLDSQKTKDSGRTATRTVWADCISCPCRRGNSIHWTKDLSL